MISVIQIPEGSIRAWPTLRLQIEQILWLLQKTAFEKTGSFLLLKGKLRISTTGLP